MSTTYFRAPGSRIEHIVWPHSVLTMCGKSTTRGARFTDKDRGPDAKIRPICIHCKARQSRIKH